MATLVLIDRQENPAQKEVMLHIARNMGYDPKMVNEMVLSHFFDAPPRKVEAGVEYSTQLWRPLLLDEKLIGKGKVAPGLYLGTITFLFSDPKTKLYMVADEISGAPVVHVGFSSDKEPKYTSLILSDLRPIKESPIKERAEKEQEYSLWGGIRSDLLRWYNLMEALLD